MTYWERDYATTSDRWLRIEYLKDYPRELWHRIPTGTQGGESNFGRIKDDDIGHLCVPRRHPQTPN